MISFNILEKYPPRRESLLLILHELQQESGKNYLPEAELRKVADYLNVTYATVYGVATYYSLYSLTPRGRHVIRLCKSPVCDMKGTPTVVQNLQELLGIEVGETTPDGLFTLELSACLGRCDSAVSMMIDGQYYGALDRASLTRIIERYRHG
jgi:NADH:ubiquinone oxidoreductase subunit E